MVSIIIPTYNDSEHLIKTVASCLVQDVDCEIVVVNDASTKPIPDNVFDFLFIVGAVYTSNPVNVGLAQSRDNGISMSSGEYILPLDTGDWLYPHIVGTMLKEIDGYDVVHGDMTERDDDRILKPPGKDGVSVDGMKKINQVWCTHLFRRSLWEKVGGYANGLHTSYEDYNFNCKCVVAGARFKYIPRLIYRHTYNPNSMLSVLHKRTDYYNELARQPLYGINSNS